MSEMNHGNSRLPPHLSPLARVMAELSDPESPLNPALDEVISGTIMSASQAISLVNGGTGELQHPTLGEPETDLSRASAQLNPRQKTDILITKALSPLLTIAIAISRSARGLEGDERGIIKYRGTTFEIPEDLQGRFGGQTKVDLSVLQENLLNTLQRLLRVAQGADILDRMPLCLSPLTTRPGRTLGATRDASQAYTI